MITLQQVLALPRCSSYPDDRVRELAGGRTEFMAADIAACEIPIVDRIWLLIHLLDARRQRLFACWCAEGALQREREAGCEPDPCSWAAVEVARRYADGLATDEELAAARAAAWAAAVDAAGADARAAAWAAARDAEWAAARAAAWAAARGAAGDAAEAAQLVELVRIHEEA